MLRTIILALALAAGVSGVAQAQTAKAVTTCGAVQDMARAADSAGLTRDLFGNLCATMAAGNLTPTPSAGAGSGIAPQTTTSSALVAKNAAGNLYGYSVTMGATAGYLAILNATAAPAASAAIAPLECVPVAANAYVARRQDIPDRYGSGIVAVSTSSCTTYTAVTPQLIGLVVQ